MKKSCNRILLWMFFILSCMSCGVYEDLEPCPCNVRFVYDWNLEYADAFASKVEDITLYVFDTQDRFVTSIHDAGAHLDESYRMDLSLPAGQYRLVAWGGNDETYYHTTPLIPGQSFREELHVRLRCNNDRQFRSEQPLGGLFFGEAELGVDSLAPSTATVRLMNNTKNLNILLQSTDDTPLADSSYMIRLTGRNSRLNCRNIPCDTTPLTYHPYLQCTLTAETELPVVKAELNTLRLMCEEETRLLIRDTVQDQTTLDINLTAYLKMFKSVYYSALSDQEWLDRANIHHIILFINGQTGLASALQIGPWKVVLEDFDM